MSDLLGIGYSGLKAYSRALSTIGDNIANAQTPGYARRRLEMMEAVGGVPRFGDVLRELPGRVEGAGRRRCREQQHRGRERAPPGASPGHAGVADARRDRRHSRPG